MTTAAAVKKAHEMSGESESDSLQKQISPELDKRMKAAMRESESGSAPPKKSN